MDSARKQLIEKLQSANHVLVTVSRNPSVDQLAACIGLTLLLNKLGKHGTAVFSGEVPSTLEFLQPDETLEKNTNSLRDFIIALDKSKADKLRYKVEDNVVRIFITPYKTSISQEDLDFSQGDFNVDVVVALGVTKQEDLDEAILAHGRILHDATVATVNLSAGSELGTINWTEPTASSLSELMTELAQSLDANLIDGQTATALLTGIVSETARFSNEKTTPQTMSMSAVLMSKGANQQLVASKLDEAKPLQAAAAPAPVPAMTEAPVDKPEPPKSDDGSLDISHEDIPMELPEVDEQPSAPVADDEPTELDLDDLEEPSSEEPTSHVSSGPKMLTEPPSMGGRLTANTIPEGGRMDPSTDPLSQHIPDDAQFLSHDTEAAPMPSQPEPVLAPLPPVPPVAEPAPMPTPDPTPAPPTVLPPRPDPYIAGLTPPPPAWVPTTADPLHNGDPLPIEPEEKTLSEIEVAVNSPHLAATGDLAAARDEVLRALSDTPSAPEPIQALNAQPLGDQLHADTVAPAATGFTDVLQQNIPVLPPASPAPAAPQVINPNAPPPVPPPIPFNFNNPT